MAGAAAMPALHSEALDMPKQATWQDVLRRGVVIPATPLALTARRQLDERRQRALYRYYAAAGAGGLAVGVHTTQFEIRRPKYGLLRPVLQLAAEEMDRADRKRREPLVRVAGLCGRTKQATAEAALARDLGYQVGLLSLAALPEASDAQLIRHCRAVAEVIPLVGFYLQPAAGGRELSHGFWRRFAEIDRAKAIKIAPFNRYQTLDVVRAIAEAGRDDLALYTGNDDNIVMDLVTPYRFQVGRRTVQRRIVGGLLGHWAVWTSRAVALLERCHRLSERGGPVPADMLGLAIQVTDANAAVFDAATGFAGCIPGVHEVLRRQGLLQGTWCLDSGQTLGPGQRRQIDRIYAAYPHLTDDAFVAAHRDEWLRA
jgi:hypothetical protein